MISVRGFYNTRPGDGILVQTDVDNDKVYSDEKGTTPFPEVDAGTKIYHVRGEKAVDGVYKKEGVYLVALEFNPC